MFVGRQAQAVAAIELIEVGAAPVLIIAPVVVVCSSGPYFIVGDNFQLEHAESLARLCGATFLNVFDEWEAEAIGIALADIEIFVEEHFDTFFLIDVCNAWCGLEVSERSNYRRQKVVVVVYDVLLHDGIGGGCEKHHLSLWLRSHHDVEGIVGISQVHASQRDMQFLWSRIVLIPAMYFLELTLRYSDAQRPQFVRVVLLAEARIQRGCHTIYFDFDGLRVGKI